MQAVFCSLMSVALVVHSAIGCCWASATHCRECQPAGLSRVSECCDHHHAMGGHDHHPAAPCKCKLGCQGLFVYLPTGKSQVAAPHLDCPIGFVPVQSLEATLLHDTVASFGQLPHATSELAPALRLHLVNQVLLI